MDYRLKSNLNVDATTPIDEQFEITCIMSITCSSCHFVTRPKVETFKCWHTDIQHFVHLDSALANSFQSQPIEGHKSGLCGKVGFTTKKYTLLSNSPIFCITLNRFKRTPDGNYEKFLSPIELGKQLNLANFMDGQNSPKLYRLVNVVLHHGTSMQGGHYTTIYRYRIDDATEYVKFDDRNVMMLN